MSLVSHFPHGSAVRRLLAVDQHHHYGISSSTTTITRPLRFFSTSSTTSSSTLTATHAPSPVMQQAGAIVTRVGPSERLPGLKGVFLTRAVKKFHPIEVLPSAATPTASLTITPRRRDDADAAPVGDDGGSDPAAGASADTVTTLAPPLVLNLAFAARHHVSLRRFLALRHMSSTSTYLHVATERGWYLVAPSTAAPLCADVEGLRQWVRRHHKRYTQQQQQHQQHSEQTGRAARLRGGRDSGDLATWEAALESGEELTEKELRALAAREKQQQEVADSSGGDEDDTDVDEEDVDEVHVAAEGHTESFVSHPTRSSASARAAAEHGHHDDDRNHHEQQQAQQLRRLPPLITESHLFEINDGVAWELPPPDDLADPTYWKGHRHRMTLYESTGDADAAEQREAVLEALRSDPRSRSCTEQELHAAAETLFQTLKQKANVALHVDDATGLLTLVPLLDLPAGTELCLHYGREWWTGRLLSSLLLAVPDAEVSQIRWIEQLFGHASDHNELFPMLVPARQRRKHKAGKSRRAPQRSGGRDESGADAQAGNASVEAASPHGVEDEAEAPLVLYNTVTKGRATDAAVLAFAVRRSCLDADFFHRLVVGDAARGLRPLFHLSDPDAPVPMRALRRALLTSLRGSTGAEEEAEAEGGEWPVNARGSGTTGVAAAAARDGEDDGGVFSV